MTEFNIIGKVDASQALITPSAFHLRVKEAIELNTVDYEKFKKTILAKPAIDSPSREWIEKQKDEKFQNLFKEMWPNVYSRIADSENKPKAKPTANEILADLENKRLAYEAKLKNELIEIQNRNSHCNCNKLNSCNCLKVCELLKHNHEELFKKKIEPVKVNETKPYPNVMSSYDFPWVASKHTDTLVKSSYNPADLTIDTKLLKEIQESQNKLKAAQKLEKTTDLVDDMISKFKQLQDEMKKKSEALKLKSEYEELRQKIRNSRSNSRHRHRSRSSERKVRFKSSDSDLSDVSLSDYKLASKLGTQSSYVIHHCYEPHKRHDCKHSSTMNSLRKSIDSAKPRNKSSYCKYHLHKDYNIY